MYCTNCGNNVTIKTNKCPYCEKPLSLSTPAGKSLRSCIVSILGIIIGFTVAIYFAFPDFWKNLLTKPATKPQAKLSKVERTAESDKAEIKALYDRYLNVLENPEPEKLRKFVQKKRLVELEDGGVKSLIYDQLTPDIAMTGLEVSRIIVEGDRAIVVTNVHTANKVTNDKGNPLGATGVAKLIHEDKGWKIFSQSWHIAPPTDPVEEAMPWLSSNPENAAARKLISLGVEFGDEKCLDAIGQRRIEVVKLCLQAGFSPNTSWMGAYTAFDRAVSEISNGHEEVLEIVKAMLAAGANVDSTTGGMLTPLMQAAIYCKPEFAEVFIKAGADVNFKNEQGSTALDDAQNCPEVKALLEQHGAK